MTALYFAMNVAGEYVQVDGTNEQIRPDYFTALGKWYTSYHWDNGIRGYTWIPINLSDVPEEIRLFAMILK